MISESQYVQESNDGCHYTNAHSLNTVNSISYSLRSFTFLFLIANKASTVCFLEVVFVSQTSRLLELTWCGPLFRIMCLVGPQNSEMTQIQSRICLVLIVSQSRLVLQIGNQWIYSGSVAQCHLYVPLSSSRGRQLSTSDVQSRDRPLVANFVNLHRNRNIWFGH